MSGADRAPLLRRLAEMIAAHAQEIAIAETSDDGTLIRATLVRPTERGRGFWPSVYGPIRGI